jgi:hypothetical protein
MNEFVRQSRYCSPIADRKSEKLAVNVLHPAIYDTSEKARITN